MEIFFSTLTQRLFVPFLLLLVVASLFYHLTFSEFSFLLNQY